MKRFLISLSVLSIMSLLVMFACKKVNILAPTYIPDETKFRVPNNDQTIPSKIDVNPQPAKNGEVFGGFIRKFQYKGEWHILATNRYYYDANNKLLTPKGKQFLLKFDKDGNLMILNSGNPINDTIWNHLTNFNIIEPNKVWYEDTTVYEWGTYYVISYKLNGNKMYDGTGSFQKTMYLKNLPYYHSPDLLNWEIKNNGSKEVMHFPQDTNWQGTGYSGHYAFSGFYKNVYFKGKLYVFDGGKSKNFDGTYDSNLNFSRFRFIDWNANGSDMNNWSSHNYPWEDGGQESAVDVYVSTDKLYIQRIGNYVYKQSGRKGVFIDEYSEDRKLIYSTTGNPYTWQKENSIPHNATKLSFYNGGSYTEYRNKAYGPTITQHATTPEPPDWVFDKDNNRYYKAATNYSSILFNGKYYSLPIPPVNEIKEAADNGRTSFTITKNHIENSGKNQFMVSLVNPTNAKESDWKLITPLEYTGYSMLWQIGGGNTLFNINGKTIQLMDYNEMQNFLNYDSSVYNAIINELRKNAKTERDKSAYYYAMYYEAQADILEAILKNGGYIEPSDAITHYEIEFRYR